MSLKLYMEEGSSSPLYYTACGVFAIATAFSLIVATLLIADYVQIKTFEPLKSPALEKLKERHAQTPDDKALKEEIRTLDLLARKAYFIRRSQIQTGGYLLLGSVVVMLVALKTMAALREKTPDPGQYPRRPVVPLARKFLLAGNLILFAIAMALAFTSETGLVTEDKGPDSKRQKVGTETTLKSAMRNEAVRLAIAGETPSSEDILKNWPCFRGPYGHGIALDDDAPLHWDGATGDGILWKARIPRQGFNSPVVWGNRVFLSGADEEAREVYCFDADTGELLWQKAVENPVIPDRLPQVAEDTGYAAPSVASDGHVVCAIFATGELVCFTVEGESAWEHDLGPLDNHYGHASSLLITGDLLLIQIDQWGESKLLALDRATGNTIWQQVREVEQPCWGSPLWIDEGRVILTGNPSVSCYAVPTGEMLWSVPCLANEIGPSPAYAAGRVFVTNAGVGLFALDARTGDILWQSEKGPFPEVASPLGSGECVFLATSEGVIRCFSAMSGNELWRQEYDEGFYASPILVRDRIYALDKGGQMHIFRAGAEYAPLAEAEVGEKTVATPAFSKGRIYIRGTAHLFCIGEPNARKG